MQHSRILVVHGLEMQNIAMNAPRVLAILLFLSCTASAQEIPTHEISGPDLVVNGEFDSPGDGKNCPFAGWVGRSGQGGRYAFSIASGKTGKCAKIDGSKAGRGDIHTLDAFPVKAGETVRVRF